MQGKQLERATHSYDLKVECSDLSLILSLLSNHKIESLNMCVCVPYMTELGAASSVGGPVKGVGCGGSNCSSSLKVNLPLKLPRKTESFQLFQTPVRERTKDF